VAIPWLKTPLPHRLLWLPGCYWNANRVLWCCSKVLCSGDPAFTLFPPRASALRPSGPTSVKRWATSRDDPRTGHFNSVMASARGTTIMVESSVRNGRWGTQAIIVPNAHPVLAEWASVWHCCPHGDMCPLCGHIFGSGSLGNSLACAAWTAGSLAYIHGPVRLQSSHLESEVVAGILASGICPEDEKEGSFWFLPLWGGTFTRQPAQFFLPRSRKPVITSSGTGSWSLPRRRGTGSSFPLRMGGASLSFLLRRSRSLLLWLSWLSMLPSW
jgi:hypothetical protein